MLVFENRKGQGQPKQDIGKTILPSYIQIFIQS